MLNDKVQAELRAQTDQAMALLTSPDWAVWMNYLHKVRIPYFEAKVLSAVREDNFDEAKTYAALLDECDRQVEAFKGWVKLISEKAKG